jgi:tetratricopeptide (TPR) repeat protein
MSVMYSNAGDRERANENTRKAFALIDRVTERERLYISSQYYNYVLRDTEKAIEAYQAYARTYPRDIVPHVNLATIYALAGHQEEAVQQNLEAIRLEPGIAIPYGNLVALYSGLDRYDESKAIADRAVSLKLEAPVVHQYLLRAALEHGDQATVQKEVARAKGTNAEYQSLAEQARNADYLGQRRVAKELRLRAAEMAKGKSLSNAAAGYLAADALSSALSGDCATAASEARAAAALVNQDTIPTIGAAAGALGFCGDTAGALKIADAISRQSPSDTLWNQRELPAIRAAIELKRGQPAKAIDLLSPALVYERGSATALAPYLRGLSYLKLHRAGEAASEFQKILAHKGSFFGMNYALSYTGLARSAVLSGDSAKARVAYQDFLGLWKDADPGIPVLREAMDEYAKLK